MTSWVSTKPLQLFLNLYTQICVASGQTGLNLHHLIYIIDETIRMMNLSLTRCGLHLPDSPSQPDDYQAQRQVPHHQSLQASPQHASTWGHGTGQIRGEQGSTPHLCGQLHHLSPSLHTPRGEQIAAQPGHVRGCQCSQDPRQLQHESRIQRFTYAGTCCWRYMPY